MTQIPLSSPLFMNRQGKGPALIIEKSAPPSGSMIVTKSAPAETKPPLDVRNPENLLQSELTQQDFVHALQSTIDIIPDPPYPGSGEMDGKTGFPVTPKLKLLQPDAFRAYDLSTLCFIFFFQPGTPQQFFAAKELKKRNWVYHIRYQTWFRRIGDPSEKTDDYEVAKYEYFDHDSEGWFVRERPAFKFEYANMQA